MPLKVIKKDNQLSSSLLRIGKEGPTGVAVARVGWQLAYIPSTKRLVGFQWTKFKSKKEIVLLAAILRFAWKASLLQNLERRKYQIYGGKSSILLLFFHFVSGFMGLEILLDTWLITISAVLGC